MDKSLKSKAVNVQGREYVMVKDRIIFFNETYQNGRIVTELLTEPLATQIVIKATVTPDMKNAERYFTGYSQAVVGKGMVNQTAAMENAETSAVGRALAMMGIGLIDAVASADEVQKVKVPPKREDQETRLFEAAKKKIAQTNTAPELQQIRAKVAKAEVYTEAHRHQLLKLIDAKLPQA